MTILSSGCFSLLTLEEIYWSASSGWTFLHWWKQNSSIRLHKGSWSFIRQAREDRFVQASSRPEQMECSSSYSKMKQTFALGLVLLEGSAILMIGKKQIHISTDSSKKVRDIKQWKLLPWTPYRTVILIIILYNHTFFWKCIFYN